MGRVARWGVALGLSVVVFAVSWWVCAGPAGLDEGVSVGVAPAVLALVLAVAGWWAARERPGGGTGPRVWQRVCAGRDAYTAGRDQIFNVAAAAEKTVPQTLNNLGVVYSDQGRAGDAIRS